MLDSTRTPHSNGSSYHYLVTYIGDQCLNLHGCTHAEKLKNQTFDDRINTLFARWFQPAQTSQPTVFSSHSKPAPASPNQPRNQPANRPKITSQTILFIINGVVAYSKTTVPLSVLNIRLRHLATYVPKQAIAGYSDS